MSYPTRRPDLSDEDLVHIAHRQARRYHHVPGYDQEDLRQEALLSLLQAPEGSHSSQSLHDRAHHRLYSILRRLKGRPIPHHLEDDEPPSRDRSPEDQVSEADLLDSLYSALAPVDARILELTYWQEMTDREILTSPEIRYAAPTITTTSAVKTRRLRALLALREANSPDC